MMSAPCPRALPPIYAYDLRIRFHFFFSIFGRTDLRISLSGAKFDEEADFDVRSAAGPPKPYQIDENMIFRSEHLAKKRILGSTKRKL